MARKRKTEELGLTVEITQEDEGSWHALVRTDAGEVVFDKDAYKSQASAEAGINYWVHRNYDTPVAKRRATQKAPSRPERPSSSSSQLIQTLRRRAADNEAQVVQLREQADLLETEAKRLHAAADVLEGPEDA